MINGYSGSEPSSIGGHFYGVDRLIGGSKSDQLFTLDQDSTFTIDQINGGTYASNSRLLDFTSFDNLISGIGNDVVCMIGTGNIAGSINAGGGVDWINYENYGSGADVNLLEGSGSGINSGQTISLLNFENIYGWIWA